MTPKPTGPLPFSIHGTGGAGAYGARYWSVGLSDGREVFLMADRLEITRTGDLIG